MIDGQPELIFHAVHQNGGCSINAIIGKSSVRRKEGPRGRREHNFLIIM